MAEGDHTHAGSSGHTIQDEGGDLPTRGHLNFAGAGVIASDDAGNDASLVTIPGGSLANTTYGLRATGAPAEEGYDKDRTTGSAYSQQFADIYVKIPIKLNTVKWDMKGAADYTLFIDMQSQGLHTLGGDGVDETWTLTDFFLMPGLHRFLMLRSASATWYDKNTATFDGVAYYEAGITYNTTFFSTYTLPMKLNYTPMAWQVVS